ncbi:MAG: TIGR04283 family arsenosugar biosynthesis glycosyltransferase, partial [Gammaproteobacteria bacterium]
MISVIIPAYNEEKTLPGTLRALFRQPGVFEVIVVDGGSSDGTRELARDYAGVRLLTAPKGRASQMNAGARAASGEWLLFLHADTQLPDNALSRLDQWEADPHYQAGGFTQRFSGDDWRLRLVSFLDNVRCRRTRIIFGDQALFVRRVLF